MLSNNKYIKNEIREIRKILRDKLKFKYNIPKFIDTEKTVKRREYITINAYIKKQGSQINKLTVQVKKLKEEKTKPKVSIRKKIINIRAEMNQRIKFFKMINETKIVL